MKPTTKVSIGGLAFNLEDDAYQTLNDYLEALNRHFTNNPESGEIIADIEYRMCELLQMRLSSNDANVSLSDAQEIIKIMGNPKDFENEETNFDYGSEEQKKRKEEKTEDDGLFNFAKKKLYRDREHGIVSGVCSGFAHYLRIDPVIIRIGIIAILIIFNLVSMKAAITVGLVYIIMTIIIPPAKTFQQKVSMVGTDPSIENIEDRTYATDSKKYRGSALSEALKTTLKILGGITAGAIFITLIAQLGVFLWLNFDTEFIYATNYLALVGLNSLDFKIAIALLSILPLIGIFCLLLKLIRSSKFTKSTLASFLIGLCFFFGSAFYVGNKTAGIVNKSRNSEKKITSIPVDISAKNLTIKLADEYKHVDSQPQSPNILYTGRNMRKRVLCILPTVQVETDSTLTNYVIEVGRKSYGRSEIEAQGKVQDLHMEYSIQDSTIYISPRWYSNNNPWLNDAVSIKIKTPANKTAEIDKPLDRRYTFKSKNKHVNVGYDSNNHDFDWNSDWDID